MYLAGLGTSFINTAPAPVRTVTRTVYVSVPTSPTPVPVQTASAPQTAFVQEIKTSGKTIDIPAFDASMLAPVQRAIQYVSAPAAAETAAPVTDAKAESVPAPSFDWKFAALVGIAAILAIAVISRNKRRQ